MTYWLQKIQKIAEQTLDELNKNWGEYEDEWTFCIDQDYCIIEICFDDHNNDYFKTFRVPVNQINLDELRKIAEEE